MFENFEKLTGKKKLSKAEQTKRKIIMATIKTVGEKGYVNASTRDIIKEADISMGTLYHHYKNKPEIILSIFDTILSLMMEADIVLTQKNYSPDKLLYEKANLMIDNFIKHPGFFRIFSIEINNYILNEKDEYAKKLINKFREVAKYISSMLEKGREQGYFNFRGECTVMVRILMGTVTGFLNFYLIHLGPDSITKQRRDILFQFIFNGLNYKGELLNEK